MRILKLLLLFSLAPLSPARADSPAPESIWTVPRPHKNWKMPPAQSAKWAARIRKMCPLGWTVTARGNDITVQRDKPVAFFSSAHLINAPMSTPEQQREEQEREKQRVVVRDRVFRLTLEFAPRLSQDQYDALAARNAATEKADHALRRKHKVIAKYNIIRSYTPAERARGTAYRNAAKRLVWHRLPDLYTTEHSATLFQSWRWLEYLDPKDEETAADCGGVLEAIEKLFGLYDPNVARGGSSLGRAESSRAPEPQ